MSIDRYGLAAQFTFFDNPLIVKTIDWRGFYELCRLLLRTRSSTKQIIV